MSKQLDDLSALYIPGGSSDSCTIARYAAYSGQTKSQWTFSTVSSVYTKPDLKILGIGIPDYILLIPSNFEVAIWNYYTSIKNNTSTKIEIFNSNNNVIYEKYVSAPAINSSSVKKISFTWQPPAKGNYTMRVTVDADNKIVESNENNNVLTKTFFVAGTLPVSGSEIPYEPNKWNDAPIGSNVDSDLNVPLYVQHQTNCYAYALNLQRHPDFPYEAFPLNVKRPSGYEGKGL